MKKLLALFVVVLGFSAVSFGQSSAVASATATLVTPLSILKTADLNFGVLSSSSTIGTATISTDGTTINTTGGVKSISTLGLSAAIFDVNGANDANLTITYPTTFPIKLMNGTDEVSITALSNTAGTKLSSTGNLPITMGATLSIPANSKAGVYSNNTALSVTVNYN